ncbi:MAG: hypothetical protein ACI4HZ_03285 [Ruminococcus sp.]
MKKTLLKVVSIILAMVLFVTSFSGCAAGTLEADASQYLTKGEWFALFAGETDLNYSGNENQLSISEDSEYYYAVMSIVDNNIIDSDTACKDLEKRVTKDVVSYTCVNYLPEAFRTESERTFSDEDKITDPKAAAEAVDYGIVEAKSEKKFGPEQLVNIDDCEKAINTTIKRLTTYEFSEEESNFEIEYNDNVYDTGAEVEVVEGSISDYTDYTEDFEDNSTEGLISNNDELSVTMMGLKTSKPEVTEVANSTSQDVVTVRIPELVYIKNKEAYRVGNIIKVQPFELTADMGRKQRTIECCYIKITLEPLKIGSNYSITGVLPTVDDAIKGVKSGQKSTNKATNGKLTENNDTSGVSGLSITSSGVKFKYTNKVKKNVDLDNGRSDRTDPTLQANFSVSVEISDIKLTTTGFDNVFLDAFLGNKDSKTTVGISYKTNVEVEASFPQTRLAPYNNGNGKFPSNLSRSRWTTGNGAKDIKIGKVRYAFGPLAAELGLYLQIHFDGKITVSLKKDSNTTYTITEDGISSVYYSSEKLSARAEVNFYAGVELRGDIHITGFSMMPICDMKAGAGFNIQGVGNLFILTKENKYTDKTNTNLSGEELQAITDTYKETKFGYCLNIKLDFKIYGQIASGKCIIGKIVKLMDKNFDGLYGEKTFPIFEKHWEDGNEVKKCTREPDGDKTEEEGKTIKAGDKIDISNYNLVVEDGACGTFYVTQVPGTEKTKDKNADKLRVFSTDESVCTAEYYKDNHMVEVSAKGEGACEVRILSTGGKKTSNLGMRYISCAIIVNANKEVSFVPSDSNIRVVRV